MEKRNISIETYNKIKNDIPKEIIEMLPQKPENLLKYAQRVKEIQFSKDVNDDTKLLMKKYLLNDEEYLKTFFYVMAITFYNKKPVENPKISIVAAQTGSGKSNLTAKILRDNENYIFVDSDKYKHFRYDAREISRKYQVLYPALTGPDAYDHADNLYRYAIDHKYNIIKETAPSANKGLLNVNEEELIQKNYRISVSILAVGELNSLLSTHERYELQIIHGLKTAKLTGTHRHDESYNALIENVKDLIGDKNIEKIEIYKRGNKDNEFHPQIIYPSNTYSNPIEAIEQARSIDNETTKKEFMDRYNLIKKQMDKRHAPKEQYDQIDALLARANVTERN